MTVDRAAVLDALREASAEGFATSKQVAAVLGIKGASPFIRNSTSTMALMRLSRNLSGSHPRPWKSSGFVSIIRPPPVRIRYSWSVCGRCGSSRSR